MTTRQNDEQVAEYDGIGATISSFRTRFGSAVFDLQTDAGYKSAKAAHREMRATANELERIRKAIKEPALRRCQAIDAQAKRLMVALSVYLDPLDKLLREKDAADRRAREDAERRERERVERIQQRLAQLQPAIAFGAGSVEIGALMEQVRALPVDESFGEFEDDAAIAKSATIRRLQAALDKTLADEQAAAARDAELAAERAERERLAEVVAAQERNAAAAAAAAQAGQLFPVEPMAPSGNMRDAAFCRSCLRMLEPGAIACACGWSMLPADGADVVVEPGPIVGIRPALSAPGALSDRMRELDGRGAAVADGDFTVPTAEEMAEHFRHAPPAAPERARPVPLDVFDDRANDCVRICGVVYSGDLFRHLGLAPTGRWFQIVSREDGVLIVRTVDDDLQNKFGELADERRI